MKFPCSNFKRKPVSKNALWITTCHGIWNDWPKKTIFHHHLIITCTALKWKTRSFFVHLNCCSTQTLHDDFSHFRYLPKKWSADSSLYHYLSLENSTKINRLERPPQIYTQIQKSNMCFCCLLRWKVTKINFTKGFGLEKSIVKEFSVLGPHASGEWQRSTSDLTHSSSIW